MPPHGHGSCGGDGHEHSHEEAEMGVQYSLYTKIDLENLECLNETVDGSGKQVFKPWEERLNFKVFVESDVDEELLFNIPFTGVIKLKGIIVIGDDTNSHPAKLRLFKNRPGMTFDDAHVAADQEFELQKDLDGSLEYSPKIVTFNNVNYLTMHFPTNFGSEKTRIYYIGLKGEFHEAPRQGVVITNYEVMPSAEDHKNPLDGGNMSHPPLT